MELFSKYEKQSPESCAGMKDGQNNAEE